MIMTDQEEKNCRQAYNQALINGDVVKILKQNNRLYVNAFEQHKQSTGQAKEEHATEMKNLEWVAVNIAENSLTTQLNNHGGNA